MNVLIDLHWMKIGRSGGMEQLACELVTSISWLWDRGKITVYCPGESCEELKGSSRAAKIDFIDSNVYELVPSREPFARGSLGDSKEEFFSPLGVVLVGSTKTKARIIKVDLVHSIGGYVSPEFYGYRNIVTILDLQHRHFPEFFDEIEVEAREANHELAIELAEKVICISDSVRRDVQQSYNVSGSKLETIWPIPSSHFWIDLPEGVNAKIRAKFKLDDNYLFYPAHSWPHKNHETLVDAFASLRKRFPNLKLILTGGNFASDHPARKKIEKHGLQESVMHLGYCSSLEIRCLMEGAKALVYPSRFEGFGLPVAEAIILGTPVVCSDIETLKEVGGDAISTFDPEDSSDIVRAVEKVLMDPRSRDSRSAKAQKRKSLFAAGPIALKTFNLYREFCGQKPIEEARAIPLPTYRRERARHWGRQALKRVDSCQFLKSWIALAKTFWSSPVHGFAVWRQLRYRRQRMKEPFSGRYGDGWIEPDFRKWLMVPDGTQSLTLRIEYPPRETCRNMRMWLSLNEGEPILDTYSGHVGATITIPVPAESPKLSLLKIKSQHYFVPQNLGQGDDSRKLSAKLLDIRWD